MSQNLTQFSMTPEKGQIALGNTPNTISGLIKSGGSSIIAPGSAVKLVNVAGSVIPMFDKAAATDSIFGFVRYQVQKNTYLPLKDTIEVCFDNSIMFMEAGGAIQLGAKLEIVASGDKVITAAGINNIVGIALTPAANTGDIVTVLIKTPLINQEIVLADLPAIAFTDLSDTPNSLATSGLKVLRVNTGSTAIEFRTFTFLDLSDTPSTFAAAGGFTVKVNSGATALEFVSVI